MERCASAQDKVWAHKRQVLSAHTLSAQEQRISERTRPVLCESKGNPRASREIRARAGRFARKQGDSRSRIILIYFRATKMRSRHLAV